MRKPPFAVAAVVLGLLLTAACGSVSTSSPGSVATSAAPAVPAAAAWHPGGTYTGPVPPAALLGPTNTWHLNPYTNSDSYKVQDDIVFGVPLHYAIPTALEDCNLEDPVTQDLPPGQYVIPFAIIIHNRTAQQAPAITPGVWITDSSGSPTLDMAGSNMNGNDTGATWANGDCETNYSHTMNQGGSDALYGLIGPTTPAQLASSYVQVNWARGANNVPGTPPQLTEALAGLLPHQGGSWLTGNTGTSLPTAAASPSSSPVACPNAPTSYDQTQQIQFNSSCDDWLGQVSEQLQFDPAGTSPLKDATDWCKHDNVSAAVGSSDTPGQLLPACLAGIKAAGGP